MNQLPQDPMSLGCGYIHVARLGTDLINLAVIIAFVILFFRTAAPLPNSRFLKHLAYGYGLIGLYYLSSILLTQFKLILAFSAQCKQPDVAQVFTELDKAGELIKLIFSSLSSCFLLLTWYLLRHHPKVHHHPNEVISVKFYGSVFTAYAAAIPLVIGAGQVLDVDVADFLHIADSVFAGAGAVMVGGGLCQLIRSHKKLSRPVRDIATFLVASTFLFWGVPQPFYLWYQHDLFFWSVLAMGKVFAGLAAVLVSIVVLESKDGFQAPNDASGNESTLLG